jgi:hypothetical protein
VHFAGGGSSGSRRRQHARAAGCFGMLAAAAAPRGGDGHTLSAAPHLGPEERYAHDYEARLNPFAEFQVCVCVCEGGAGARGMCGWACTRCHTPGMPPPPPPYTTRHTRHTHTRTSHTRHTVTHRRVRVRRGCAPCACTTRRCLLAAA